MKYIIDNEEYDVVIEKKHNKNTYIRVKEDLKISVTTNYLVSKSSIKELLDRNVDYLEKMISKRKCQLEKDLDFYYLGNRYDIILVSSFEDISIVDNKIYAKDKKTLDKWYKKQMTSLYEERVKLNYDLFEEKIPYPDIKIRNMKTRWGVCNKKSKTITLNSNLMKYDVTKLDYVIIHELSHFLYFDHSSNFWNIVAKYCPNYKKIRRELRD